MKRAASCQCKTVIEEAASKTIGRLMVTGTTLRNILELRPNILDGSGLRRLLTMAFWDRDRKNGRCF